MDKYKVFFDEYGFTNYEILDINDAGTQPLTDGTFAFPYTPKTIDQIGRFVREKLNTTHRFISGLKKVLENSDNILIDDGLDFHGNNVSRNDEPVLYPFLIMEVAEVISVEKLVWIGLDPYHREAYRASWQTEYWMNLLLESTLSGKTLGNCSVTLLRRIMRCSEKIWNMVYAMECRMPLQALPLLGHKIIGLYCDDPIIQNYESKDVAVQRLCQAAGEELEKLLAKHVSFEDIAVILSRFDEEDVLRMLSSIVHEKWPPYANFRNKANQEQQSMNSSENLTIVSWRNVSSEEWPYVIHISLERNGHEHPYYRYRAMSRATTKLVNIYITYENEYSEISENVCTHL